MKNRIISALLAAAMIFSLLFSGCSLFRYRFAVWATTLYEPYAETAFYDDFVSLGYAEDRTYIFDISLTSKQRTEFMNSQEKLCAFLAENGLDTSELTFYVFGDYKNRSDSAAGVGYYDIDTLKSWEQILTTVQTILGDYTNYGYLYALSDRIAQELEWNCDEIGKVLYGFDEENIALLNLVYPCFSEQYANRYDIAMCKTASVEILSETSDIWSPVEFWQKRLSYAKSLGLEFYPTYLEFAYNGGSCPLKLATKYLEVFWDPAYYTEKCYFNSIKYDIELEQITDIGQLLETYEKNDELIAVVCENFNFKPVELVAAIITPNMPILSNLSGSNPVGVYTMGNGRIYATTEIVLLHEYTHHITYNLSSDLDYIENEFQLEALAYYYAFLTTFEEHLLIIDRYPAMRADYNEAIGGYFDTPYELMRYVRCMIRNQEQPASAAEIFKQDITMLSSFGEYFVRTYGNEAFMYSMMFPETLEGYTGKTLDEVIEDWYADVLDPANDEHLVLPETAQNYIPEE